MNKNTDLSRLVRQALEKEEKLRNCLDNIYILVKDGAVTIAGLVTQESVRALAKKIVSAVPGVNRLVDDVKVAPAYPHRVGVQIDWATGNMALKK